TASSFLRRAIRAGIPSVDLSSASTLDTNLVGTFELPQDEGEAPEIADDIANAARADANGRAGKLRYELTAVRLDGRPWGRCTLVVDGGPEGFGVEQANLTGVITHLVNRDKELTRMMLNHSAENHQYQVELMANLQKQLAESEKTRM